MNKLSYTEAMAHIRKYKDFYSLKAIAEAIKMNPCQFRNAILRRDKTKTNDLPSKYRTDLIRVVQELTGVRQVDDEQTEAKQLDQVFRGSEPEPF